MEHASHFNKLLEDTVNLPDGKLDSLKTRTDAIFAAVKAAKPESKVLGMKRQGSWAQRTIINPPKNVEFDADFMLELEEVDGWSPTQYNDAVYDTLADHAVYGSMVEAKNRCIRVSYANDMHVDVVPYVNRATDGENIINTKMNDWEPNDASGFTAWMKEKDDLTDRNMRRVLRLLKYLRDHRGWYPDTVSIILTTVVGNTVKPENLLDDDDCYSSVPVTLGRIVTDLARWVRENPTLPDVEADDTSFTHRWTETKYQQFSTDIHTLDTKIAAALRETDEADSLDLWRDLFGTGFKTTGSAAKASKFPAITTGAAAAGAGAAGSETAPSRSGKAG